MTSDACPPYTALADIYDQVMAHVDYDGWAAYLVELIKTHAAPDASILELGCGTGSLTVNLTRELVGPYRATDNSPDMLAVARNKLVDIPIVELGLLDFKAMDHSGQYDVVLLAYDGINYAHDSDELKRIMAGVARVMRPGGLFMFDQSTPENSINNLSYFDDEFAGDGISYSRTSNYDRDTRTHTTRFAINDGTSEMVEHHIQHAFTRMEMLEAVEATHMQVIAMLSAFEFGLADDETERIQWVLRKPASTDHSIEA